MEKAHFGPVLVVSHFTLSFGTQPYCECIFINITETKEFLGLHVMSIASYRQFLTSYVGK